VTVVSNTSPLIALSSIGHIDILHKLYGDIAIPDAVFEEVTKDDLPGCEEVRSLDWFKQKAVENKAEAASLTLELDTGEAEAITLALELKADLLLIDERKGKLVADRLSVRNIGVLGVLIEARHKNLIKAVKPLLDDLIIKAGFWFDTNTYNLVLQKTGEK
jgi:predicted nucleic acid-binding protein